MRYIIVNAAMYHEKPKELLKKYALPHMIGLLVNSIYLIVDGIFIGNRLGRDAMAAAAVAVPMIEILIALSMAVSVGAGIIVSNCLGAKDESKARSVFNQSLIILLILSVGIVIFGNIFIEEISILLGATPDILKDTVDYLYYIITFSPALLFSFAFSSYARNDNKPKLAMAALVIGSFSNILLDYIFMYPLNMGIKGAALATAIGPILSVIILFPHFFLKKGILYFEKVSISLKVFLRILELGSPAFITEFAIGIVTFIYNFAIVKHHFGEIGLASYLIIGYLALIILTLFLGISQGIQPIMSYFNGEGKFEKNKVIFHYFAKFIFVIGIITYIILFFFSKYFIMIFTPDDHELILFTTSITKIYFIGFVFAGLNILIINFLQSVGKSKEALIVSLLRCLILLPLFIVVLPLFFGSNAIWIAVSLTEVITFFICCLFRFVFHKNDNKKSLQI